MTDETKPSVPGSTSPLSPPIKTPPSSQASLGGSSVLPPNLPTGEVRPGPGVLPFPPRPTVPPSIGSLAQGSRPPSPPTPSPDSTPSTGSGQTSSPQASFPRPELGTKAGPAASPSTTITPPKPVTQDSASVAGQPSVFKSSIRTMQEDIVALRKGSAPVGFSIEKQSEKDEKMTVQPVIPKPPTFRMSPQMPSHIELGKLEKSKPLARGPMSNIIQPLETPSRTPELQPTKATLKSVAGLPSFLSNLGGFNSRKLIWGGVGLLVVVVLVVYFFVLSPSESEFVLAPTPTPVPSSTVLPGVEGSFSAFSKVNLGVGANVFASLILVVNEDALAGGEPGLYQIVDPQSGFKYSFSSFMSSASVLFPEEITPFIDNETFYLTLIKKTDGSYSAGFIVKLKNDVGISEALNRWEVNMPANLRDLFILNLAQAASINFLDNTYQGSSVRYMNFPDILTTIDYSVTTAKDGSKYLIVVDSRDHIFSMINHLR